MSSSPSCAAVSSSGIAWRQAHPDVEVHLSKAWLSGENLTGANLDGAYLHKANLSRANLKHASFIGATLSTANLSGADLREAWLPSARLYQAVLREADLRNAKLNHANLTGANLSEAELSSTDLTDANLTGANPTGANLKFATLVRTSLLRATLDGCNIFGLSAWKVQLDGATQTNLRITDENESAIKVDDLRVAQFLHQLLNNQEIRAVLDTITSKVVLILGRFSTERKPALDALRTALRQHPNGYIPVLFDFEPQQEKPILETVKTLANLARFVVVDLTDPNMVRSELTAITTSVPSVPIRPLN
jgi:hypothetical protein